MPDLPGRVGFHYELRGKAMTPDGDEFDLGVMDDSFRCWLRIVRWNIRGLHWAALRMNAGHLFTKVIWRKLWRRS